MSQGQVLKREWTLFLFHFLKVYHFYIQILFYIFEEKLFFLPTYFYEKSPSKLCKNEPVYMYKESWCVGLGQKGVCLREGRVNCPKYLKVACVVRIKLFFMD